jgi:hypothetical protein
VFFEVDIGHQILDVLAYQTNRKWINICNGPRNSLKGFWVKNLHPQEVDVSTSPLKAYIHFATSFPRVRFLDIWGFFIIGNHNLC